MSRDLELLHTEGLLGRSDPLEISQLDPPAGPAVLTQEGDDVEAADGHGV
jgi:hypothetical protein